MRSISHSEVFRIAKYSFQFQLKTFGIERGPLQFDEEPISISTEIETLQFDEGPISISTEIETFRLQTISLCEILRIAKYFACRSTSP